MNTLRKTCVAAILSLALAVSALAGHIDTTGAPAPPPPSASTSSTSTTIVLVILSVIYP